MTSLQLGTPNCAATQILHGSSFGIRGKPTPPSPFGPSRAPRPAGHIILYHAITLRFAVPYLPFTFPSFTMHAGHELLDSFSITSPSSELRQMKPWSLPANIGDVVGEASLVCTDWAASGCCGLETRAPVPRRKFGALQTRLGKGLGVLCHTGSGQRAQESWAINLFAQWIVKKASRNRLKCFLPWYLQ